MKTHESDTPLLIVENLTIELANSPGSTPIVQNMSFQVSKGEVVGLVGESGSGKSMLGLAVMGLLPRGVHVTSGKIVVDGLSMMEASDEERRRMRGATVATVFQDPGAALNPTRNVRQHLIGAMKAHSRASSKALQDKALATLEKVGFPEPKQRYRSYPFQLSGGLRQRVAIAMALINNPKVLIADEPTTSLDVSVQKGILDLIRERTLDDELGCIFVSHDLGVIAQVADRVIVMYSGQKVEEGRTARVLSKPRHPYTEGLIASAPTMSSDLNKPLRPIPGTIPRVGEGPQGCTFQARCPVVSLGLCSPSVPEWASDLTDPDHRWFCRVGPEFSDSGEEG